MQKFRECLSFSVLDSSKYVLEVVILLDKLDFVCLYFNQIKPDTMDATAPVPSLQTSTPWKNHFFTETACQGVGECFFVVENIQK